MEKSSTALCKPDFVMDPYRWKQLSVDAAPILDPRSTVLYIWQIQTWSLIINNNRELKY
jgi:hypothetical protein